MRPVSASPRAARSACLCITAALVACQGAAEAPAVDSVAFRRVTIDRAGPSDIWGKAAGDLDGDGRPDLLAGGHGGGGLVAYVGPDRRRRVIAEGRGFGTDHEIADLDGDGRADIVSVTDRGLLWFQNPDGTAHAAASRYQRRRAARCGGRLRGDQSFGRCRLVRAAGDGYRAVDRAPDRY